MAIDSLFTKEEQIEIIWAVRRLNQEYKKQKVPPKKRYYFTSMAQKYLLPRRVENQIKRLERLGDFSEEITTYQEIADLFEVNRSVVTRYIRGYLEQRDYKAKEALGRKEGGSKGGQNGDKAANFKSHRNA